jgi:hypothetical protein
VATKTPWFIDPEEENATLLAFSSRETGLPLVGSTELAEVALVASLF